MVHEAVAAEVNSDQRTTNSAQWTGASAAAIVARLPQPRYKRQPGLERE